MAPSTKRVHRGAKSFDGASAVRFSNVSRMNMRDSRGPHKQPRGTVGAPCERHPWLLWYNDPTIESQFVVYMTQDLNVRLALTTLTAVVIAVFIPLFARVSASIYLYSGQMLVCAAASLVLYHVRWVRAATKSDLPGLVPSVFASPSERSAATAFRERQLAERVEWTSEALFLSNWLFVVSAVVSKVECRPLVTLEERRLGCYVSFGWDAVVIILMLFPVLLTPVRIVASACCTLMTIIVFALANLVIAPEQLEVKRFWSSFAIVCAQAVMCTGASYVREAQLRKSFEHGLARQRQTLELQAVRKLALEGAESLVPMQVLTSRIAGRACTAPHYVVHFGLAGFAQWSVCRGPCDVVWMLEQYNKTLERFMGTLSGGISLESIGDLFVVLVEALEEMPHVSQSVTGAAGFNQPPIAKPTTTPAQEATNLCNAVTLALIFLREGIRCPDNGPFLTTTGACEGGSEVEVVPVASMDVGLVALHLHSTGRVLAEGPALEHGRLLLVSMLEREVTRVGSEAFAAAHDVPPPCGVVCSLDFQRRMGSKWSFNSNTTSSNRESSSASSTDGASTLFLDIPQVKSAYDVATPKHHRTTAEDATMTIDEQLRRSCFKGILAKFAEPQVELRYAAFCRDSVASDFFLLVLACFFVLIAAVCVLICGIYGAWSWTERSPLPYFVGAGAAGVVEVLLAVVEPHTPRHRGVVHAAIEVLYYAFCGCLLLASLAADMSIAVFGSSMVPVYFLVLLISFMRPLWHSPGVMLVLDVFASVIPFVDIMLPNHRRFLILPSALNKSLFPCGLVVMLLMRHVMDAAQRDRFVALEGARLAQEKVEKEYALLQVVVEQLAPKRIAALLVDRRKHASRGDEYRGELHPLVSTAVASSADDVGFAVLRFWVPPSADHFEAWSLLLAKLVRLLDGPPAADATAGEGSESSTRNRTPLLVSASGDTMVVSSCRAGSAPTAENVTDVMECVYEIGGVVGESGSRMSGYVGVCPLMGAMLPGPRVSFQLYGGELTAATAVVQHAWPLTAGVVVGSARACYYNAEHCRLAAGARGAVPYCAGPSLRWRLRNVGTLHVHLLRLPTCTETLLG